MTALVAIVAVLAVIAAVALVAWARAPKSRWCAWCGQAIPDEADSVQWAADHADVCPGRREPDDDG